MSQLSQSNRERKVMSSDAEPRLSATTSLNTEMSSYRNVHYWVVNRGRKYPSSQWKQRLDCCTRWQKYRVDGHADTHSAIPSCPTKVTVNFLLCVLSPVDVWRTNQQRSLCISSSNWWRFTMPTWWSQHRHATSVRRQRWTSLSIKWNSNFGYTTLQLPAEHQYCQTCLQILC